MAEAMLKKKKVPKKKATTAVEENDAVIQLQKELNELMHQYPPTLPSTTITLAAQVKKCFCPIHQTEPLMKFQAKSNGKTYYNCKSKDGCGVFCAEENVLFYCKGILTNLHSSYQAKPSTNVVPICNCNEKQVSMCSNPVRIS